MRCLNCDQILFRWKKSNRETYDKVRNNLGNNLKLFSIFRSCLRDSLTKYSLLTKDQKCLGCHYLSIMIKTNTLEKKIIEICYGKYKGKSILISKENFIDNELVPCSIIKNISNRLSEQLSTYYKEEFYNLDNIYYYSTNNKYENLYLVSCILQKIYTIKELPFDSCFLWGFVCKDKINMLTLKQDFESFEEIADNPLYEEDGVVSENIIVGIVNQLIINLSFLSSFYFTHNEPIVKYLKFSSEATEFSVSDKSFVSSIKLHLIPSFNSSVSIYNKDDNTWGRFHYKNREPPKNFSLPVESFIAHCNGTTSYNNSKKHVYMLKDYQKKRIVSYKIGTSGSNFLKARIQYGCTIFHKSFDAVCFLISMMLEENCYQVIMKMKWWKGLWKNSEYESLMEWLEKYREENKKQFQDVYKIVRSFYIRLDALEYLVDNI